MLNEKERQAVVEYMEQVNKLRGVPSQNKSLIAGRQKLYVESTEETKSKSGKPMLRLKLKNVNTGASNMLYVMHTDRTYNKLQWAKVGYVIDAVISGVGGFVKCMMLDLIDTDVELPEEEFMNVTNIIAYDVEVFKYDWSVVFEDVLSGKTFKVANSLNKLQRFFQKHENNLFISYNGKGYDQHIVKGLMDSKDAYTISKQIIDGDDATKVYNMYNKGILNLAEVDLYQDNKGFGLKEHNAFNGLEIKESDIDFDIDRKLTEEELEQNMYYNTKDVEGTTVRFIQMIGALKTKAMLCEMFDLDYTWLFQTNANIIARILKAKWHDDRGDQFDKYEKPDWIRFDDEDIQRQVNEWILDKDKIPRKQKTKNGEKYWTTDLSFDLKLRDLTVKLGSGGLHASVDNYIKSNTIIKQADVGSLYPNTIRLHGYLSRNIPKKYAPLYSQILADRMKYKHAGEKDKEQAMKLVLNTMYGVLRAKFNPLYDPRQAILINITGQLAMLDLADKIQPYAFISALNTDSINYEPYNEECDNKIEEVKKEWCKRSGYELDTDVITDIVQKDVNNYICRFDNGKIKKKGAVSMGGGIKHSKAIVYDAVTNYFMDNKPVEDTVKECTDLRDFQIISKTGYTFHETRAYTSDEDFKVIQKVNRSFAVKDNGKHELVKIRKFKLGVLPERPVVKEGLEEDSSEYKEYVKQLKDYNEFKRLVTEWSKEFGLQSSLDYWKKENGQLVKGLPTEPDNYTIANESIYESPVVIEDLDLQYYIDEANQMIEAFKGNGELVEDED